MQEQKDTTVRAYGQKGRACGHQTTPFTVKGPPDEHSISGLVVEYIVAIDVTRVRFPADAF